jgi:type IV secretory pathway TraG/TraD family ATPase VirD4
METQLYYRPTDLATATYLQERLGKQSAYAHSTTERERVEASQGLSEQAIPLLTAQDIMQLKDEEMIGFHRRLPPFKISRMDWRHHPTLQQRRKIPAPRLSPLPQIADLPLEISQTFRFPNGYIDPDMLN